MDERKNTIAASMIPILFLLPLLAPSIKNRPMADVPVEKAFFIDNNSELFLEGSSNVNRFSCNCYCYDETQKHSFELIESGQNGTFSFRGAFLRFSSEALDCGNKGINKDMYRTLKADQYPDIHIELLRGARSSGQTLVSNTEWMELQASTAITIAGVKKTVKMRVKGKKLDNNRFQFVSATTINMSDFGLDPPRPMLGLIKVDDQITIHLDLVVRIAGS